MASELSAQEKMALIKQGLQEVLKEEIIADVIEKEGRPLKIYWGTAPTGRPHCGYWVPMVKLAHFLRAGCEVKVLLADLHAFLDNLKAPLELVSHRSKYYELIVKAMLRSIGVPIDRLTFVKGSDYQRSSDYVMDIFRLSSIVTEHDAKKAGAEVVKQVASPLLSGLIYPLMQALDEQHLDVDAQFGGVDQRKIFTLAAENLPKLGMKERAHLMNPMVPGLAGGKMSASDPNSKIDLLDSADVVKAKLKKALCAPGEVDGNGVLSFVEYVIFPIAQLSGEGEAKFHVPRPDKFGGPLDYSSFEKLKQDYAAGELAPGDLKAGLERALNALLEPIRQELDSSPEFQRVVTLAYPPAEPEKKKKKEKKIGTGYVAKDKGKQTEKEKAAAAAAVADGVAPAESALPQAVATSAEEAVRKLDVNN